jgi:hypothetical protein
MTNYWPLDGALIPRSRLSSLNTIRTLATVKGMTPFYQSTGAATHVWISEATVHGLMSSTGSISLASFVSAGGLGVAGFQSASRWQYVHAFAANLDNNMVIAAGPSTGTLVALYQTGGSGSGLPLYSYLTSAPKAACVGAFDNYIIAFHIQASAPLATRVQWCVRGNPSNWTGEGSGFEDLLDMRGSGTRVLGTNDGRLLLFSNLEIWYGVSAPYPAQFQFLPFDRSVGCAGPGTIVETDIGVVFLGSDMALRVIPRGGGASEIISGPISQALRSYGPTISANLSWAVYDPDTKIYHLFLDPSLGGILKGFVLNVVTGEWGFADYNSPTPDCGAAFRVASGGATAGLYFGNSTGTVQSANSKIALENGSVVTSTWRSAPIASDLAGNHKQLTQVDLDYRATSRATVNLSISQDGGNNYGYTAPQLSLSSAPVSGRATSQVYVGGANPALEMTSTSTGYELHRVDLTMNIGGRR